MKFSVEKKELENHIKQSSIFIPKEKKNISKLLYTVWIKAEEILLIQVTNSEIQFLQANCQVDITEKGIIGVNCWDFLNILKSLPKGKITLSSNQENFLTLCQGQLEQTLSIIDHSWHQKFMSAPTNFQTQMNGRELKNILNKVKFVCDDNFNEIRIAANGTSNIEICAMNNYQFVRQEIENSNLCNDLPEITVNKKNIDKITRWLRKDNVKIAWINERLYLRQNKQLVSAPAKKNTWIKYSEIYSYFTGAKEFLQVNKQTLLNVLERTKTVITKAQRCCVLYLTQNQLLIEVTSKKGKINERIEAIYNGDIETIAFPVNQLIEVIKQFNSENIVVYFTEKLGPAMFIEQGYQIITMPVKIEDEVYEVSV